METYKSLLQEAGIAKALIIDDAYDTAPFASDILESGAEWSIFFDDLTGEDLKTVKQAFPQYDQLEADELSASNDFIASLWENRESIAAELIDPIFESYRSTNINDLQILESLQTKLEALGLTCHRQGRDIALEAYEADIVIVDLFLGHTQLDEDSSQSIKLLRTILKGRESRPPLVILMSRSPRLSRKSEEFRDEAGLFESQFRILSKSDLTLNNKLERILARLASHYDDSCKLVEFLYAIEGAIQDSCKQSISKLRTLDLPDLAQIQQLMLSKEGAPIGSYLVDVFDKVMCFHLENNDQVFSGASGLNEINTSSYPPPHIAGSRNLQRLVYKCLFQGPKRLSIPNSLSSQFSFGDLFVRSNKTPYNQRNRYSPFAEMSSTDVLLLLTPACDLARKGTRNVLLLRGSTKELDPASWTAKSTVRTSVYYSEENIPHSIEWDIKHTEMVTHDALEFALSEDGMLIRTARLREAHALEIQQRLLSDMGRVGILAPLPGTFSASLTVCYYNTERRLKHLIVAEPEANMGTIVACRDSSVFVLSEAGCESIIDALSDLDLNHAHESSRDSIKMMIESDDLRNTLEKGIELPSNLSKEKKIPSAIQGRFIGAITGAEKDFDKAVNQNDIRSKPIIFLIRQE